MVWGKYLVVGYLHPEGRASAPEVNHRFAVRATDLNSYPRLPLLGRVGSMGPCLVYGIEWMYKDSR